MLQEQSETTMQIRRDVPPSRWDVRAQGVPDRDIRVALNGVEQREVLFYDINACLLQRYVTNEKGELITVDGELLIETLTGNIMVKYDEADGS